MEELDGNAGQLVLLTSALERAVEKKRPGLSSRAQEDARETRSANLVNYNITSTILQFKKQFFLVAVFYLNTKPIFPGEGSNKYIHKFPGNQLLQ